jgi:hypothetical protein
MGKVDWQELGTQIGAQPAAYNGGKWDKFDDTGKPRSELTGYRRIHFDRLTCGVHPSGIGLLNPAKQGTCGTCQGCITVHRGETLRAQYKCRHLPVTHDRGRSTDVNRRWPACERYIPAPPPPETARKRKPRS